ncbi:TetR family transcriptional regulator [Rugosimonospora acidiphila]|uniref:TetR family transcriptional regulator n=1 Tax=Rugosimonospora acidiphila TaxID=556531 RepID=A0ABP9SJF5_9ACTN
MARWEGNARGRLERAALTLFGEQGYDGTTVAQIAQRANLTERSFYRWFSDKREVLFAGDDLEAHFLAAIEAVPAGTGAMPTLLAAFASVPEVLRPRDFLRERAVVIAANPPLRERELIKMASMSATIVGALLSRGFDEQTARLATEVGSAVLGLATRRWMDDEQTAFADLLSASASDLLAVAADGVPAGKRS